MILYHACREKDLKKIIKEGLNPNNSKSSQAAIYLADCADVASNYSCQDDEKWILLKTELKYLNTDKCQPDDYELTEYMESMNDPDLSSFFSWEDVPWELSLKKCNQIAYHSIIEPKNIFFEEYLYDVKNAKFKNNEKIIKLKMRSNIQTP